ncbi:MAG: hypothetical protein Q9195_000703 [Heterodermia aff. obscurata]
MAVGVVYTCQKPQPTRCGFFLWGDEARGREAAVVLKNSRSEPKPAPQTPPKSVNGSVYMTPQTGNSTRSKSPDITTPYTPSKSSNVRSGARATVSTAATQEDSTEELFYDWPLSDDEELLKAADQASSQSQNAMPPPETPRKAVKIDTFSTPGKRRLSEMENDGAAAWPTPVSKSKGDDVFTTPANGTGGKRLFTTTGAEETPTPVRFKDVAPSATADASLATEILKILKSAHVPIPPNTLDDIRDICNKQSLFTHGVIRGRDISRSLISKKDEKIVELQNNIEALHSERETSRAVIRHLRRELGVMKSNDT